MPLNRHLWLARGSRISAEMTLLRRIARLMSPLCNLCIAAAVNALTTEAQRTQREWIFTAEAQRVHRDRREFV